MVRYAFEILHLLQDFKVRPIIFEYYVLRVNGYFDTYQVIDARC